MQLPIAIGRRGLLVALGLACLAALVATLLATQLGGPASADAADHRDAPGLTPPGGDVRADINDVYAFQSPTNAGRTVLVMTVNGLTPADTPAYFGRGVPGVASSKAISYFFHVDNDGDAIAEVTYRLRFGKVRNGVQAFELRRNGRLLIPLGQGRTTAFDARPRSVSGGGARVFAGMSDDPFFFDLNGFVNIAKGLDAIGLDDDPANNAESFIGCASPRQDAFAGTNVSTIVLEVPDGQLLPASGRTASGASTTVGVWAATTLGGKQVDRMGRPAINTVFNPVSPLPPDTTGDSLKDTFNKAKPKDDQAMFRGEVVDTLEVLFSLNDAGGALGGADDPADDAMQIAGLADVLLPDLLTIDLTSDAGFLNGRKLADDVIDAELGLVTEGLVTTDCVGTNDVPFRTGFPYVGAVHG